MISTPKELEQLQSELRPLEAQKAELKEWAERRTQMLTWIGLGEEE
jgi:flagellar motility protein MotE (MotC chaperone)